MDLTTALTLIADATDGWDHHDWGDGWWVVMVAGMALFWGLVIAGIVWAVRSGLSERGAKRAPESASALEILDRRFAEGAIDVEEYRERRDALRDSP